LNTNDAIVNASRAQSEGGSSLVPAYFGPTWLQEIQLMSEEEDRKLEYIPPFVLAGVVKVYEIIKIRFVTASL